MLFRAVPQTGSRARDHEVVVSGSRIRARRRWIIKAFSSLAVSAAVLVLLIVLRQDGMSVDECKASLGRPVVALQAAVDRLGQLPATLPDTAVRGGFEYAPDIVREYARQAAGPVIIGNSPPVDLLLRADGNGVVLYDSGKVRCEWWPRVQFINQSRAQAARIRTWDEKRRATLPQLP